jgi:site-specific DNA recombinase
MTPPRQAPLWPALVQGRPRYTGRQVWNRQRKDEVLMDVNDVALGHTTKLRWSDAGKSICSDQVVHPPIINARHFHPGAGRAGVSA